MSFYTSCLLKIVLPVVLQGTSLRGAKAFRSAHVLNEALNKLANEEIHSARRNETLRGLPGRSKNKSAKGDYSVGSAVKRIQSERQRSVYRHWSQQNPSMLILSLPAFLFHPQCLAPQSVTSLWKAFEQWYFVISLFFKY